MKTPTNPTTARPAHARGLVVTMLFTVLALALALTGCAAKRQFRFAPSSIHKVTYDEGKCKEIEGGKVRCRDVVFTLTTVDAK